MIEHPEVLPSQDGRARAVGRRAKGLGAVALLLGLCFSQPLYDWARFAWHSELYSHTLLVPFISLYLCRVRRQKLVADSGRALGAAVFPLLGGLGLLAGCWLAARWGWKPTAADYLSVMTLSFLLLLLGASLAFLGARVLRQLAFPAAFLIFMVPFPSVLLAGIERFFQFGSADAAQGLFWLSGMPVLRQGMEFHLPGFSLQVAPQCSGIHSSLVLFITSLLAGHLFLAGAWRRAVLALAVIPLALLRNGLRIAAIGHLCVQAGPQMIDSPIHRQGGPLFFALSLVPFLLLLFILKKSERSQI